MARGAPNGIKSAARDTHLHALRCHVLRLEWCTTLPPSPVSTLPPPTTTTPALSFLLPVVVSLFPSAPNVHQGVASQQHVARWIT